MARRNKTKQLSKNNEQKSIKNLTNTVIAALGLVIVAIIGYFATVRSATLPIAATQTAEALHTSIALTAQTKLPGPNGTNAPTVTLTPSAASNLSETDGPANSSSTLTATSTESTASVDSPDYIDAFGVPMRLVPAGSFTMGSSIDRALVECKGFGIDCKREWFINEEPIHEVYLDAYYIDKYEVTNKFYRACVDGGVCIPPILSRSFTRENYYDNSEFDDYPVVYVNWNMAETYCEWRGARLPTEAQWEKAARGTDQRIFPWGDDLGDQYANFNQKIHDTTMVGYYEKGKSPFGVYDLAGNTVEWVYDWYSETYYQNSLSSNPVGPDQGDGRVVRGGSWFDKDQIRSAWREGWQPVENADGLGFRCAMNLKP
jgi:formylglycine-generating enzyme required for sulfatase activity